MINKDKKDIIEEPPPRIPGTVTISIRTMLTGETTNQRDSKYGASTTHLKDPTIQAPKRNTKQKHWTSAKPYTPGKHNTTKCFLATQAQESAMTKMIRS